MARRYVDGRGLVNEVQCNRTPYCEFAKSVNKCKHSVPHISDGCMEPGTCDMAEAPCLCQEIKT